MVESKAVVGSHPSPFPGFPYNMHRLYWDLPHRRARTNPLPNLPDLRGTAPQTYANQQDRGPYPDQTRNENFYSGSQGSKERSFEHPFSLRFPPILISISYPIPKLNLRTPPKGSPLSPFLPLKTRSDSNWGRLHPSLDLASDRTCCAWFSSGRERCP